MQKVLSLKTVFIWYGRPEEGIDGLTSDLGSFKETDFDRLEEESVDWPESTRSF